MKLSMITIYSCVAILLMLTNQAFRINAATSCAIQDPREFSYQPLQEFFDAPAENRAPENLKERFKKTSHQLMATTPWYYPTTWVSPLINSWKNAKTYDQIKQDITLLESNETSFQRDLTALTAENFSYLTQELLPELHSRILPGIGFAARMSRTAKKTSRFVQEQACEEPLIWGSCAIALALATPTFIHIAKKLHPTRKMLITPRTIAHALANLKQRGQYALTDLRHGAKYVKQEVSWAYEALSNR